MDVYLPTYLNGNLGAGMGRMLPAPRVTLPSVSVKRNDFDNLVLFGAHISPLVWVFFGPIPARSVTVKSSECAIVECLPGMKVDAGKQEGGYEVPLLLTHCDGYVVNTGFTVRVTQASN